MPTHQANVLTAWLRSQINRQSTAFKSHHKSVRMLGFYLCDEIPNKVILSLKI